MLIDVIIKCKINIHIHKKKENMQIVVFKKEKRSGVSIVRDKWLVNDMARGVFCKW